MRAAALAALADADVVLYLVDGTEPIEPLAVVARVDQPVRAPVILVVNKIDLISAARRDSMRAELPDAQFISAATGDGVDQLLDRVAARLPESPFLYPDDEIATQSVRFFVSELIRETALEQLDDEVPYSIACEIEEYREGQAPVYIRAVLHVERESQKRILIGAGCQRIRAIGQAARAKIEAFVGTPTYLDLWVKVLPNWRRKAHMLQRFGYTVPEDHTS
jgi:GTP-binding protein Era